MPKTPKPPPPLPSFSPPELEWWPKESRRAKRNTFDATPARPQSAAVVRSKPTAANAPAPAPKTTPPRANPNYTPNHASATTKRSNTEASLERAAAVYGGMGGRAAAWAPPETLRPLGDILGRRPQSASAAHHSHAAALHAEQEEEQEASWIPRPAVAGELSGIAKAPRQRKPPASNPPPWKQSSPKPLGVGDGGRSRSSGISSSS
mmetsp:Transcript_18042/g.44777  ORF Transcript_18042/g.44777 Transcript_18042/m.44777 type:complete len:206 (-) Transcript_18042:152-769(-)